MADETFILDGSPYVLCVEKGGKFGIIRGLKICSEIETEEPYASRQEVYVGFHEILPQTDFSVEMGCVRTEFFYDLQSGGPLEIEILRRARSAAKKKYV